MPNIKIPAIANTLCSPRVLPNEFLRPFDQATKKTTACKAETIPSHNLMGVLRKAENVDHAHRMASIKQKTASFPYLPVYAFLLSSASFLSSATMHKFSLSPAEQVERNRKEAEAAKAREAELPQGISDQWSLADKARFLGGSNGVPGIDDITEEEALNIALNRFADLGYDLGSYDVSVWYKLYDYFAAPTMPSPDEMNPFYVIFFSDDLAAPTKVFSIIIDADTGDIISEGAPAPSNG